MRLPAGRWTAVRRWVISTDGRRRHIRTSVGGGPSVDSTPHVSKPAVLAAVRRTIRVVLRHVQDVETNRPMDPSEPSPRKYAGNGPLVGTSRGSHPDRAARRRGRHDALQCAGCGAAGDLTIEPPRSTSVEPGGVGDERPSGPLPRGDLQEEARCGEIRAHSSDVRPRLMVVGVEPSLQRPCLCRIGKQRDEQCQANPCLQRLAHHSLLALVC